MADLQPHELLPVNPSQSCRIFQQLRRLDDRNEPKELLLAMPKLIAELSQLLLPHMACVTVCHGMAINGCRGSCLCELSNFATLLWEAEQRDHEGDECKQGPPHWN